MHEDRSQITRRSFLKKVIKGFFLVLSVSSAFLFSLFAYPGKIRKKSLSFLYACEEDNLPSRGVRQFYLKYTRSGSPAEFKVYIVRTGAGLFALSPVCTHLGCLVNWHRTKNRFLCPCHGGQYDINGNVLEGPPPAPLNRLPLKIENGKASVGIRI